MQPHAGDHAITLETADLFACGRDAMLLFRCEAAERPDRLTECRRPGGRLMQDIDRFERFGIVDAPYLPELPGHSSSLIPARLRSP